MKLMTSFTVGTARFRFSLIGSMVLAMLVCVDMGHSQDAVFKVKNGGGRSKISGKITAVTPDGVTIDKEMIASADIRKVTFSNEPKEVGRARDQMDAGQFSDCITELAKIKSGIPNRIQPEVAFLKAYSNSQVSIRGGNVTAQDAGKELGAFIGTHPSSYHLYPAMDQYGKQLFAFGKLELAAEEFKKLSGVSWTEYQLKGYLGHGMILTELGRYPEAMASFDAILQMQSNDDMTQEFKLLARCEKAKIQGLQGDVEGATKAIEAMIDGYSPDDNKRLFAHLYNALGAVFEKSGNVKRAAMNYLRTELLFPNQSESHSEALYRLALIWPKLDFTDRASRARGTLKSRYRNSYWASKL